MDAKIIVILLILGVGVYTYYYPQTTWDIADKGLDMVKPNKTIKYISQTTFNSETNNTIITLTPIEVVIEQPVQNVTEPTQNVTTNITDSKIVGKPYGFNCISSYDCTISFMKCFNSNCICNKESGNCELI